MGKRRCVMGKRRGVVAKRPGVMAKRRGVMGKRPGVMAKGVVLLGFFMCLLGRLHSQAIESSVMVKKTQQPAAQINVSSNPDVAEDAIKEYMEKRSAKSTSYKGYFVFQSCKLDSTSDALSDLYFRVEKKGSDENEVSTVTLFPTKKDEDPLKHSPSDHSDIEAAKAFLNNMAPFIEARYISVQADNQDKVVEKAKKRMSDLRDDSTDLEKKIRDVNADLAQNKNDQEKQNLDIQSKANLDFDTRQKAQKKMNKLIDTEADLQKKLRKAQGDLDDTKQDMLKQQKVVDKEQQTLADIKSKQPS